MILVLGDTTTNCFSTLTMTCYLTIELFYCQAKIGRTVVQVDNNSNDKLSVYKNK